MKPKSNSEPRVFMAATVLLMVLSASCMLVVGLRSNFASPTPQRTAAQALSHPVRTSPRGQMGALRGRVTRLVAYFARSG